MDKDNYGRQVTMSTVEDMDFYAVSDGENSFTLEFPKGTPIEQVYSTINAMAPG